MFKMKFIRRSFSSSFKLGKLNHIAIATREPQNHIKFYKQILGAEVGSRMPQPDHGVYTTFINLPNTKIEILEELGGESSPIHQFLEKNTRGGIHHICYEVDDINAALEHFKKEGIRPVDKNPKIGAHGNPVIFLHPRDCNGILTELEQIPKI